MPTSILIVDDDPVQRRLISATVERLGHQAVVADSGQAALDLLSGVEGDAIALIILDLVMPGLDGMGLLARLRERERVLPVIVETAQDYAMPGTMKGVEIIASKLGDSAGITGAAVLARRETK